MFISIFILLLTYSWDTGIQQSQ